MSTPWNYAGSVASFGHRDGVVTLVEGQTFCLSGRTGDFAAHLPQGLFFLDARVLSRWQLRVNGQLLEPLTVAIPEPFDATFATRSQPAPGRADAHLVVFRHRSVGNGMRERILLRNYSPDRCPVSVELVCGTDFASLFAVKEGRVFEPVWHAPEIRARGLRFRDEQSRRATTVTFSDGASVEPGAATWRFTLDPHGERELCLEVAVELEDQPIAPRFGCGATDDLALPQARLARWRGGISTVATDSAALARAVRQSTEDLGALHIFDPDHPDLPILAAGAPWFMTVFGRDSLLASWMSLLFEPDLARGVLETLARFQGTDIDPATEEQPGRILHEMRFGTATRLALGGGHIYYGTVDATPLFVMLLAESRQWGLDDGVVTRLLPHALAAVEWIETFGDMDGDGYVEYQRATPDGLANQGWKDSWDGICFADGTLPQTPIALCEVQGYVYAAYLALAELAREWADAETSDRYTDRATRLKHAFNRDFWLDEHAWFALGLDATKRPIDALASNVGHCLWTGIVDEDKAAAVADRLLSQEMFSGWGVRTLATSMAAYNPVSYHNGSVWPHDSALAAAGLMRYGFVDHAHRIIEGLLDAATANQGRLPELFAGFDRDELIVPAPYPASCVPQAWASATPLFLLRVLLRFDPSVPLGRFWVDPMLPPSINRLRVAGIELGARHVTIEADGDEVEISSTDGLEVVQGPRPPPGALD